MTDLSKAQRTFMERCPQHAGNADKRTYNALWRRGLVEERGTIPNPHMPAWPYRAINLTDAGRALLSREPQP